MSNRAIHIFCPVLFALKINHLLGKRAQTFKISVSGSNEFLILFSFYLNIQPLKVIEKAILK
jgi:hypothetical protein